MPVSTSKEGVVSVAVIHDEKGVASLPVSPNKGVAASFSISQHEQGMAPVQINKAWLLLLCLSVKIKEVRSLYLSVHSKKEVWPLCFLLNMEKVWPLSK